MAATVAGSETFGILNGTVAKGLRLGATRRANPYAVRAVW